MRLTYIHLFGAIIITITSILACTPLESQPVEYEENIPRNLRRALSNHGKMILVYGGEGQNQKKYQAWAEKIASNSRSISIIAKNDTEITEEELATNPIFLVGSFQTNKTLASLSDQLPFQSIKQGFLFEEKQYEKPDDIGVLSFFPNPLNPGLPLGAIVGGNDEAIFEFVQNNDQSRIFRSLWSRWGFQIYRNNQRLLLGNFNKEWKPDSLLRWSFNYDLTPARNSEHYSFYSHSQDIPTKYIEAISIECEARIKQILDFTGQEDKISSIGFHIYPTAEMMGLMNNRMVQSFIDFEKHEVHVLVNSKYENNFIEQENQLIFRELLGKPQFRALEEGLAINFAPKWQKKGFGYWAAAIYRSNNYIPLKDLLDDTYYQNESPLFRSAMAGAFVHFLIEQYGKEAFLDKYKKWTSTDFSSKEKEWESYLENLAQKYPFEPKESTPISYQKGMTFSHEGYSIYDGYGSKMGAVSLSGIKSLGANAVAIVPYSGSRSINSPSPYYISNGAGGENDASVIHAHHIAKSLGLTTLLKPQLWFPGSWPGDVKMKNEEDWDQFFIYYRRWIRHYAMLAEIHDMEAFCVGVEFSKATQAHPEKWAELVRDLRQIYRGKITYAANWGEEFENLAFAEELDFVGLNFYYPLSKKEKASKKDLEKGFAKVLDKIEGKIKSFGKPVVLTEVGFRSISHPWIHPHAKAENRIGVEKDQAVCYEVLLDGLKDKKWCKGMYWWKWPSFMDYAHNNPTSFTPCGKEAELVLKKYYSADSFGE